MNLSQHRVEKRQCPNCLKVKTFPTRNETCGTKCANERKAAQAAKNAPPPEEKLDVVEEHRLRRENSRLRKELAEILGIHDKDNQLAGFLQSTMALPMPEAPAWVRTPRTGYRHATPTAFLSDTHFGEIVFPAQIENLNGYNRKIAEVRLKNFFNNTCVLAKEYLRGLNYPGIVCPLGGDLFSGDIHEELAKTNEGTIQEEILYWIEPMLSGIRLLADEFGKVFIPAVVGNHPRGTKKPAMKMRVPNNFDFLFVELLKKFLVGDKRITFANASSADIDFTIYNTRYRMSHGDQFRGGSGIAGVLSPLMIGDARKRKRAMATRREYDWLLLGHWHQRLKFKHILVNGSLKGYDEYAYTSNFDPEPPEQSFWLTDPKHGLTIDAPIHVLGKDENWSQLQQSQDNRVVFQPIAA